MIRLNESVAFTAILTALAGLLFLLSLDLGPVARLVPMAVLVPVLALLLFELAVDLVPGLEERFRRYDRVDLLGVEPLRSRASAGRGEEPAAEGASLVRREWGIFAWILLLLAAVFLLGLLASLPLYALAYLRWRCGEGWTNSIVSALVTGGVLYGVFVLALRIRLYDGLLWEWLRLCAPSP